MSLTGSLLEGRFQAWIITQMLITKFLTVPAL
jgi:hypothetical protein